MNIRFGGVIPGTQDDPILPLAGVRSKERVRLRLFVELAVIDGLAILFGFLIGGLLRFGDPFSLQALNIAAVILPVFFFAAANGRAYNADVLGHWRLGIAPALLSLFASAFAALFFSFWMKASGEMSRLLLGISLIAASGLLVAARALFAARARKLLDGAPLNRVLIRDGADCVCPPDVQIVDAAAWGLRPDVRDPFMLDRLGRLLKSVDGVVIACPQERRDAWAAVLKGANILGELVVPEMETIGGLAIGRFGALSTVAVSVETLGPRNRVMKRMLDVTLAVTCLVALGPLMLFTALAILLEDGGPVLFAQKRLGRGNLLFTMYKFRSMRVEACDANGNRSTGRDDDRVTRVGRIIRATSIDELPQILNVLIGDMSFVGPRPHALGSLAGDALFWEVDHRYWHRHASKPGLTGLAQVRGFRGATHARSDLVNRLQADLEYQNGWTIWRDLAILVATVRVVVHRNAF